MTVQAKIPASRAGGSGIAAGPIAAPRVVNNRRLRAGGIALAIMLVALGMALSAIALVSATRTHSYIAMKQTVQLGTKITADDLTTVQLSGGDGLSAIPADQINLVVGKFSQTTLIQGTLLAMSEVGSTNVIIQGNAQIGIGVKGVNMPAKTLDPGTKIWLVPTAAASSTVVVDHFEATVVSSSTPGSDGSVTLYIAIRPSDVSQIVTLSLAGNLGVVLAGTGN